MCIKYQNYASFFCYVIFVAIATRRLNLQSVLFLNHEIQELLFMYDDERYLYQSTKVVKIDLKTENCKILLFSFGCVLIVAMTTICLNLQSVSLLGHNIQELLYKNDDERYPYQSTKFAKIDFKMSKIAKLSCFCLVVV